MTTVRLGDPISPGALREVTRALQLRHGKWDTQVGDASVLFAQPLLLGQSEWRWLCAQAERAAHELIGLERLVASRPDLQRVVGVPRSLRRYLAPEEPEKGPRVLRFDFHPTRDGWRVSEVNADVPGGFLEAAALPALYAPHCTGVQRPPCPLTAWGEAVAAAVSPGPAAVLHAPGHLEDTQVALTFARELCHRGFSPHLVQHAAALSWQDGRAFLGGASKTGLVLVIRFYQAEWLAALPARAGWRPLFTRPAATCVLQPPGCIVSESKRLGLLFGDGDPAIATLRALFPACREPRDVDAQERADWVLKATYANTGDEVHLGKESSPATWRRLLRRARWHPGGWVAQRRFDTLALPSTIGPVRPCVGIYVVAGRAAGAYVRLSRGQVTDARAFEAPLFIQPDDPPPDDP